MGTAADAVNALLASLGHAELDAEVIDYVVSVLEDSDSDIDSLLDLLTGILECVGPFAALDVDKQTQLVLQLLDDAKPGAHTGVCSTATDADDNSMHAVVAALRQAKLQCQDDVGDPCSDITNTRAAGSRSSSRSSSSDSSTSKGPNLGPLLELCPAGISSHFVQHCLQHNLQGDMQAAANWLLETDPAQLVRQQQAWERDAEQRELERQEAERQKRQQKKAIVDKFDLRVVSDSSVGCKKGGRQQGPDLLQVSKKAQQQESKLRYRDGKVVSMKGEKVIIERVGEDWDGGSRGKVYTKGKRGKGFH